MVLKYVSDTLHYDKDTVRREDIFFQDQLDTQTHQFYKYICMGEVSMYAHYCPVNHTDEVAPYDAGPGAMAKHYMGVYLEKLFFSQAIFQL